MDVISKSTQMKIRKEGWSFTPKTICGLIQLIYLLTQTENATDSKLRLVLDGLHAIQHSKPKTVDFLLSCNNLRGELDNFIVMNQ